MSVTNVMINVTNVTNVTNVKTLVYIFHVLYPSRGSFKIFGENRLQAFVTEKLAFLIVLTYFSSLLRISMFCPIIILQVGELIY